MLYNLAIQSLAHFPCFIKFITEAARSQAWPTNMLILTPDVFLWTTKCYGETARAYQN